MRGVTMSVPPSPMRSQQALQECDMRERTGLRPSRCELWAGRSLRSARLIRRSLAVGVGRLRSRRLLYFAAVRQPTPHHRSCRRRLRRNPPAQATATKKVPPIVIGRLEAKGLRGGCSRKARSNAIPIRAAVSPIAHKSSTCNHVLRVLSQEVIGSSCTRRRAMLMTCGSGLGDRAKGVPSRVID